MVREPEVDHRTYIVVITAWTTPALAMRTVEVMGLAAAKGAVEAFKGSTLHYVKYFPKE